MNLQNKSWHLALKVMIAPSLEGGKVQGSWKNRDWKKIMHAGSRVEETD